MLWYCEGALAEVGLLELSVAVFLVTSPNHIPLMAV